MKHPHKRMGLIDNWKFSIWRPFVCQIKNHNVTCYKLVPKLIEELPDCWAYMCNRCMSIAYHLEPCGRCSNERLRRRNSEEDGEDGEEGEKIEA